MAEYTFRLAKEQDRQAIIHFMNTHWEIRHPLVNLPDFFDYYYKGQNGALHFAIALQGNAIAAIAGYIPASSLPGADIWVSIWVADKAMRGAGLELMAALPQLTGCRTLACNNIRPNTRPFYEFLGYTTGRVGHFYRLAQKDAYRVARIQKPDIPPVTGKARLTEYTSPEGLLNSGFVPPVDANPCKDMAYIVKRYYHFPRQKYRVFGAALPGEAAPRALLAVRAVPVLGTVVLRIADYIGETAFLPQLGNSIENLLQQEGAEYADFYCAGIDTAVLRQAGFAERKEDDANIIPNYLDPPLFENTEYYYFTSRPEGFVLCKADGDQDRPNIEVPNL